MQGGVPLNNYHSGHSTVVENPQQPTIITPLVVEPVGSNPITVMYGQVAALVMISLTGFVLASGEIVAICCIPLGILLALPGALYAKQKKSDYFMVMGVNPPTHPITWVTLILCVFVCLLSFVLLLFTSTNGWTSIWG